MCLLFWIKIKSLQKWKIVNDKTTFVVCDTRAGEKANILLTNQISEIDLLQINYPMIFD